MQHLACKALILDLEHVDNFMLYTVMTKDRIHGATIQIINQRLPQNPEIANTVGMTT